MFSNLNTTVLNAFEPIPSIDVGKATTLEEKVDIALREITLNIDVSTMFENEKAGISSSINIASSSDKTYLCFENKYAKYVDTLEVFNGSTKVLSVSPYETKQSAFELSSLEKDNDKTNKHKIVDNNRKVATNSTMKEKHSSRIVKKTATNTTSLVKSIVKKTASKSTRKR